MHLWKRGEVVALSKHFNSNEFECPCGCDDQIISEDLIEKLETLRVAINMPIKITSGYRCCFYQNKLKLEGYETATGVSQHELGEAADIVAHMPVDDLAFVAEKIFEAVGKGKTFCHCDTRTGKTRYWVYAKL